jgi:hypothetical protein
MMLKKNINFYSTQEGFILVKSEASHDASYQTRSLAGTVKVTTVRILKYWDIQHQLYIVSYKPRVELLINIIIVS